MVVTDRATGEPLFMARVARPYGTLMRVRELLSAFRAADPAARW